MDINRDLTLEVYLIHMSPDLYFLYILKLTMNYLMYNQSIIIAGNHSEVLILNSFESVNEAQCCTCFCTFCSVFSLPRPTELAD